MVILYGINVSSNSINMWKCVKPTLGNDKFITALKFALIDYIFMCEIFVIDMEKLFNS